MPKSVNQGIKAAVIKTATYKATSSGYNQIKYTTEDAHNFEVGQTVTVTGITGGTSANISKLIIVNIPTVNSFIVSSSSTFATGTAPVVGTGVNAVTAYASNSMSGIYELKYATPEPSTVAPYYLDITTNINAAVHSPYPTDGSVSVDLNWSAIGGSNPIASYTITQTVGTTTTTLTSPSPIPAVGSTTVTGLTADTIYTYGFVASNSFKVLPEITAQITVPRLMYAMTSITASATASTANSISISWVRPTVASPLPSKYELQRASSTDNITWSSWLTLYDSGNNTSYIDTAVTNSTYYKYRVRAFNGSYNSYLESSSIVPYFITTPMTAPTLANVSGVSSSVTVNVGSYISNPTVTQWTIDRSTDGVTWSVLATSPTLPYTDTTTSYSTQYYYRIKATNGQLTSAYSSSANITTNPQAVPVQYLVIAGGGGGAGAADDGFDWYVSGGGGGAGGLRTNAGPSGGGASAEPAFNAVFGSTHLVTIGSGGNGGSASSGSNGGDSAFSTITCKGGGGGGQHQAGLAGGSGGGGSGWWTNSTGGGPGTANQGYSGGGSGNDYGGSGGGAGASGPGPGTYNKGGIGVLSSITGTSIGYAGGGGGGDGLDGHNPDSNPVYGGVDYGGGQGAYFGGNGGAAPNGKGGGGGGASSKNFNISGGRGGDGVVIIAYPNTYPNLTVGAGLTYDQPTRSGYKVYRFTSGSGNITFPS